MSSETKSLYQRLGGYDAISAVANDLLPRLRGDPQLGRFWAHRGEDGIMREKQLLIDTFAGSVAHAFFGTGAPASRRKTHPRPRRPNLGHFSRALARSPSSLRMVV